MLVAQVSAIKSELPFFDVEHAKLFQAKVAVLVRTNTVNFSNPILGYLGYASRLAIFGTSRKPEKTTT